ncbi:MAG: LmeA family phospholipid-binding protein, partial [Microcystaceae cyanobacterium]
VLSPALRLWLRSQVEQVEELHLKIMGRDRQILSGYIPGVLLSSRQAVYQGLHLGEVQLKGERIRINLGQVLKGKPLRLLEPVQVSGEVRLEEADLKASLSSPLLSQALIDLLATLLEANGLSNPSHILENYQVNWQEVSLDAEQLTLMGTLTDREGKTTPVRIRAGLALVNGQILQLNPLQIDALPEWSTVNLKEFQIDLGPDVELEQLSLASGILACGGRLLVRS